MREHDCVERCQRARAHECCVRAAHSMRAHICSLTPSCTCRTRFDIQCPSTSPSCATRRRASTRVYLRRRSSRRHQIGGCGRIRSVCSCGPPNAAITRIIMRHAKSCRQGASTVAWPSLQATAMRRGRAPERCDERREERVALGGDRVVGQHCMQVVRVQYTRSRVFGLEAWCVYRLCNAIQIPFPIDISSSILSYA